MNYLFIDTECANPKYGSICTFGYFMTDENFVKIESEDILMNPETEYDPYVARNILRYSLSELDSNMPFPCNYDRIKELLCRKQTLVFGFSLSNDIRFLNETCMRYRLPSINCGFYDVQKIFSEYTHSKNEVSIEKAVKSLDINVKTLAHRSDEDARASMEIAKAICVRTGLSLPGLVKKLPSCSGNNKNFVESWNVENSRKIDHITEHNRRLLKYRNKEQAKHVG